MREEKRWTGMQIREPKSFLCGMVHGQPQHVPIVIRVGLQPKAVADHFCAFRTFIYQLCNA
eukprot:1153936-Pelagomonas_calceolata.AAC.8